MYYECKTGLSDACVARIMGVIQDPSTEWDVKNMYTQIELDRSMFLGEPIWDLMEELNVPAKVLKMAPFTTYTWHRDVIRLAAFNYTLGDPDSFTLMKLRPEIYSPIVRIPYNKDRFTLLDVQIPHAVVNFERERHVISIPVRPPKTYGDALKRAKALGL